MRKPRAGSRPTPITMPPRPMRRRRSSRKSNKAGASKLRLTRVRSWVRLLAKHVQQDAALVGPAAMLEQIDRLPSTEAEPPAYDGNGEMHLSEGGAQVRGHVVRAFVVVLVERRILGDETLEECLDVRAHRGRGVLLDEQRRARVCAE